jgi:hypothetical protein
MVHFGEGLDWIDSFYLTTVCYGDYAWHSCFPIRISLFIQYTYLNLYLFISLLPIGALWSFSYNISIGAQS